MSGIRKRRTGDSGSQGGPGMLKLYSDQTPGIKIGPTSVLVLSLLFIGLVVALHIWGKFRRA
ncbi:Protein transport protein Sec61 subunit beta [Plasmodiophora brassicae]